METEATEVVGEGIPMVAKLEDGAKWIKPLAEDLGHDGVVGHHQP